MNLSATIELFAGGQGSGCNPEKGKCGRTATGEQKLPRGRMGLQRVDSELRKAASARNVVLMEYRPGDAGQTRSYLVAPYSYRGNVFFGYDMTAKGIKAFKMMNIVRVEQTSQTYKPKWKIELAARKMAMEAMGEPSLYEGGHVHYEGFNTFHPPSLKKPRRVPVDDPREDDDRFLDVTKRKSKATKAFRDRLTKQHNTLGGVPFNTGVNSHSGVFMPFVSN